MRNQLEVLGVSDEGEKIVWISEDKNWIIGYGEALWVSGFHIYKRIGKYQWENMAYMTIYSSVESAKKAIDGMKE